MSTEDMAGNYETPTVRLASYLMKRRRRRRRGRQEEEEEEEAFLTHFTSFAI